MANINLPPPAPLQFLQPGSSTVNWNWHDWFYRVQTLAANVNTTVSALNLPGEFTVTGNNTPTVTVTWTSQLANKVLASPNGSAGIPSFRQITPQDYEWGMVKKSVATGESVTIPAGYQMTVHVSFTVSGTLNINGELWIENSSTSGGVLDFSNSANSGELFLLW